MCRLSVVLFFNILFYYSQYVTGNARVTLYTCPQFRHRHLYHLVIPQSLRIPYPPQVLQQLSISEPRKLFDFDLTPLPPDRAICEGGLTRKVELHIQNSYTSEIKKDKRNSTLHLYSSTLYYFTATGFLKAEKFFYPPQHYCISSITPEIIGVEFCHPRPDYGILPKCCPLGMIMKLNLEVRGSKVGCTLVLEDWSPPAFTDISTLNNGIEFSIQPQWVYQHKILGQCPNRKTMSVSPGSGHGKIIPDQKQMRILNPGKVYTRVSGNHRWENLKMEFCIDGLLNTADSTDALELEKLPTDQIILACEPAEAESSTVYSLIYFCGFTLSGLVSLMTFLAYLIIWNTQNVHGWTVAMLSISVCLNSVFIATGHGYGLWGIDVEPTPICIGVGILAHFFYIASYAWMTVLNFDLFTTLMSMVPTSKRSKGKKLFGKYSLFGFGIPFVVVTISITLETQFSLFDDRVIRPQYGRVVCHLDKSAELYHSVIINAILILTNLILAGITILGLVRAQQSVSQSLQSSKRSKSNALLLVRLLVVMGISWIFDVISWIVSGADESKWYWVMLDLYNCIQSLILFWIFIINANDTRTQLLKKFECFQVAVARISGTDSQQQAPTISSELTMSK